MKKIVLKSKSLLKNNVRIIFCIVSGMLISGVCSASDGSDLTSSIMEILNEYVGSWSPIHCLASGALAGKSLWQYNTSENPDIKVFKNPVISLVGYPLLWSFYTGKFF